MNFIDYSCSKNLRCGAELNFDYGDINFLYLSSTEEKWKKQNARNVEEQFGISGMRKFLFAKIVSQFLKQKKSEKIFFSSFFEEVTE